MVRARIKTWVVPVSGGKDSQTVLAMMIDQHGRSHLRAVFQSTGYDHPVTLEHLAYMEQRYNVPIEVTKSAEYSDLFDLVRKEGYFPNSKAKACTSKLKQEPFARWIEANDLLGPGAAHIYLGMRAAESSARANKYGGLTEEDIFSLADLSPREYLKTKGFDAVTVSLPIVQMSTEAVFSFLAGRGDKVNPLYAKGHSRVGCFPCLLANQREWQLAVRDKVGHAHIEELVKIENEFKVRPGPQKKLIRIHESRDIDLLLKTGNFTGDGTLFEDDDEAGGCQMCNI